MSEHIAVTECPRCEELSRRWSKPKLCADHLEREPEVTPASHADVARLEAKLDTVETLLRVLTRALEAGAIGRWRDLGPRP